MNDNAQPPANGLDAYAPPQIAARVKNAGVAKAVLPTLQTLTLSVLAGAFGAMFFTLVMTNNGLGFGVGHLVGGMAFSLGLVLVVIAGAELFTGNNLTVMAWADGKITLVAMLRNWLLLYAGNFAGAVATAVIVHWSGILALDGGAVGETAVAIAKAKVTLPFAEAFFRAVLCNTLVCLAVWLCFAADTVAGKILAIILPISAFVAIGFEHSVANMYFISMAMLAPGDAAGASIAMAGFMGNLVPVTLGNIIGGSALVALVYWIIYIRRPDPEE